MKTNLKNHTASSLTTYNYYWLTLLQAIYVQLTNLWQIANYAFETTRDGDTALEYGISFFFHQQ